MRLPNDNKYDLRVGVDGRWYLWAYLFLCSWLRRLFFLFARSFKGWTIMAVVTAAVVGPYWFQGDFIQSVAWGDPMQKKPIHNWIVVNEFGDSKCFVDKNSVEKRGDIVRSLVMYSMVPPGVDKRNNKAVKAMLNVEDYDLRAGTFRVQRITFQYSDETDSGALQTGLEWKPATGGNQRTLEFLKTLDYSKDETISIGGVSLDATYAGFSRGTVTDNEGMHPGLGYTVPYQSERRDQATIYVYNKERRDITEGPMSETVMAEFNEATHEVLSVGHSAGTEIKLIERYGTGTPERGSEFLCAVFILSDEHGPRRTFLYLTGAAGSFVKIRVTLRTNDATDPTARNFADAVARRIWW